MATRSKYQGFDNFVSEKENIIRQKKRDDKRSASFRKPVGTDLLFQKDERKDSNEPYQLSQSVVITEQNEFEHQDYDVPPNFNESIQMARNTIDN